MNKAITLSSSIGIVFTLELFFISISSSIDAQAKTEPVPYQSREKIISVIGYATAKVDPDLLTIQFGVEAQEKTAKEAPGTNRVDSVSFGLSTAKQTQTNDVLLDNAVDNARLKEHKTLAQLNYKVIGIKYVSLSEFNM